MLHHGKKLLFLVVIIMSCQDKSKDKNLAELSIAFKAKSIKPVTESVYKQVYKQAKDSLQNWAAVGLKSAMNLKVNTWELDSLICFNKNGDKFISSVGVQLTKYSDTDHDGMYHLYGVMVNGKWYFFFGPYLVLKRLAYQKDIHTPLPFSKLHSIAIENIFNGYLKKNKEGKWEINEGFFTGFAPKNQAASGYGSCFACKTEEEYYLYLVNQNWEDRDTTE